MTQPERTLQKSVSLLAGWLTAATVISTSNLLLAGGIRVSRSTATGLTGAMLLTAGRGRWVSRRFNDPYYLTTLIAAFVGIAAKQTGKHDAVARLAGVGALALTAEFVRQVRRAQAQASVTQPTLLGESAASNADGVPAPLTEVESAGVVN